MQRETLNCLTDKDWRLLAGGTRKRVYLLEDEKEVVKAIWGGNLVRARRVQEQMTEEYGLMIKYLLGNIVESQFALDGKGNDSWWVTERQRLVVGLSMKKAVDIGGGNEVTEFLNKCLFMYRETEKLPDIYGRIAGVGFYNVLSSPNVIVEEGTPLLVDNQFNRINRMKTIGRINNYMLYFGILYALGKL